MDKIIDSLVKAAEFLRKYPMTIFIALTVAFGSALWHQTAKLESLLTEVGELRSDVKHYESSLTNLTEQLYRCE